MPSNSRADLQLGFRRHLIFGSRAEQFAVSSVRHPVLSAVSSFWLLCVRFFEQLTVAGNWTRCYTQYAILLQGVTDNCYSYLAYRYARSARKSVGLYVLLHTVKTSQVQKKFH